MGGCVSECAQALFGNIQGMRKIAKLGTGGFAIVWHAQDRSTGKHCAVKCVSKKRSSPVRLTSEIEIMNSLNHENILRLSQHFEDDRNSYLVLELCLGGDLFDRCGRLTESECALVFCQTLLALEHMHKLRIAHRDLKPENVLFARAGPVQGNVLKVADFGLSGKLQADVPRSLRGPVGSPHYSAPEVFRGHYGLECDLWSAGVLLFVCLSGTFPFDSHATQQISLPKVCFQAEEWNAFSQSAKELVRTLLEPEATCRVTATAALQDAWFRNQLQDKLCCNADDESQDMTSVDIHGSLSTALETRGSAVRGKVCPKYSDASTEAPDSESYAADLI
jgi:calcium-dependent protein kinase